MFVGLPIVIMILQTRCHELLIISHNNYTTVYHYCIYLSWARSIAPYIHMFYLSTYVPIYLSTYLPTYLPIEEGSALRGGMMS